MFSILSSLVCLPKTTEFMRFIIALLLSTISISLYAQDAHIDKEKSDTTVIKNFIKDLANPDIAVDIILSQYLVVEEPSDEIYDYLEVSLEEVRLNLLTKDITEISYIPYHKMPKRDVRDISLTDLSANKVYFLFYKKTQMLALYLEEDKIASFTLVASGNGKATFVLY